MESTAIAQVCWADRKPFLIVRSLSDLASGQDGVNAADSTEGTVPRLAATVVREVVRQLRWKSVVLADDGHSPPGGAHDRTGTWPGRQDRLAILVLRRRQSA